VSVVRRATRADLRHLGGIEADADRLFAAYLGADPGWPSPPAGERRAAEPGFVLVAAPDDGPVLGFVHVLEIDGAAHLEQLSVASAAQRQGRGRALVEAAKAEAASRGHGQMSLMTYADVPWNAPFYATCGFVQVEPATPFHRRLIRVEEDLGLARYGRRVLMVTSLTTPGVTSE